METTVTPAPAPIVAPPPITAERAAANEKNFSAFQRATEAERRGAPLPDVAASPAVTAAPSEDLDAPSTPAVPVQAADTKPISKRQQATNDAIREAVERATADLTAEVTRLRAQSPQAQTPPRVEAPTPAPAAQERFQTLAEYTQQHPEASLEDYMDARDTWREDRRTEADRTRSAQSVEEQTIATRISAFDARVAEVAKTDPQIVQTILPIARDLIERDGPYKIVGDLALDSDVGPQALRLFQQDPDALARLVTVPEFIRQLHPSQQVAAHLRHLVKAFGKLEASLASAPTPPAAPRGAVPSSISAAPPPPPQIDAPRAGADSEKAAIARGDSEAVRAMWAAERAAKRRVA